MLFYSAFYTLPKHKLAVIVMSNSATSAGVVQLIAREALTRALTNKTGIVVADEHANTAHHLAIEPENRLPLPGYYVAGAIDEFVWFDEFHPTARVHDRIGRALFAFVPVPSLEGASNQ